MFQRIFFAAVVSGVIAGLFATAVQSTQVIPLIYEAEKYERREPVPIPQMHEDHAGEGGDASRLALTLVSNVVSGVGFALLLVGCFALRGNVDWRRGILWGAGGFIVFSLAPAVGLPPELPGVEAAPLPHRQLWWILTAAATAAGLGLLAFKPGAVFKALGLVLVILPHIIGAPHPAAGGGPVPHKLLNSFILTALMASAAFWVVLGLCAGYFFNRLKGSR